MATIESSNKIWLPVERGLRNNHSLLKKILTVKNLGRVAFFILLCMFMSGITIGLYYSTMKLPLKDLISSFVFRASFYFLMPSFLIVSFLIPVVRLVEAKKITAGVAVYFFILMVFSAFKISHDLLGMFSG